jgi:tripartite-type tricarboxylate transporter receptor subunit TctC
MYRWIMLMLSVLLASLPARAQDYPVRPIRAITNLGAGGLSDILMRGIGDELHKRWGQTVVVENRPGGSYNIGARACAEAAPDGYTICVLLSDAVVYNPHLFKSLPFDERALHPVMNLAYLLQVLAAGSALKARTIDDLVAYSKANPGTLSYQSASPAPALYMEKLKEERGADWVRVPFKSGADAVNAMLTNVTPIALLGEGNIVGHIRSGTITPLAMLNNIRSPNFSDVPTLADLGYRGAPSRAWFGLFVPSGTPRPITDRIAKEISGILTDPAFRERQLTARSLVAGTNVGAQFAEELRKDRTDAAQVVTDAGLAPQ